MRAMLWVLLVGCGTKVDVDTNADGDTDVDTAFTCDDDVPRSACDNPASVIRGQVRLAPGSTGPTTGTLFVALAHEAYSGEAGGGYHIDITIPSVDLAAGPVPFELDMCLGGAMWSEENCDYGLVAILDQADDQAWDNLAPAPGEPATRIPHLALSCGDAAGPCLDVVLDCTDGASCVAFSSPATCACSEDSCPSDYALCQ